MTIPAFEESEIRRYATAKSWQRGEDYYLNGNVRNLALRDTVISAEVEGNHYKPYQIGISFSDKELAKFSCSCPYSREGICKHQVAVLLTCIRNPQSIESRPTIEEILDRLNDIQTQALIQQLVAKKPELIDDVEAISHRLVPPVAETTVDDSSHRPVTINHDQIKSQVRNIIKDSERAYYYGEYIEEDPTTEEIEDLIAEAEEFTKQQDFANAIAMLTAITDACVQDWHLVDEYGVDNDYIAHRLDLAWCDIFLRIQDLSAAEKTDLQVSFEFWCSEWGSYFAMSQTALDRGWDYPPLQQILQGTFVPLWQDETPHYAEKLVLLRLQILHEQNRLTEYLYLADAAGLVAEHLTMLASLDRVSEAMQYAQSKMQTMEEALSFSKALVYEQNARTEALAIAKLGLNLPGNCRHNLAAWMAEIANEMGDTATTIKGKVIAFQEEPSYPKYLKLQEIAAENWKNIKQEVLAALNKSTAWGTKEAKIDIYIYEGYIDKAIAIAEDLSYYERGLVYKVMDAAVKTHPDWVIYNASKRAEGIVNEGKAKNYEYAIKWLERVRQAYQKSDRASEWQDYRTQIMTIYARKRKFISLMQRVV